MTNDYLCSFCGKSEYDVDVIITGPAVYICDQCIGVCITHIARIAGIRKRALEDAIEMIHHFEINNSGG